MEHRSTMSTSERGIVDRCQRKDYTPPVLTVFGDVVALTRNMACGGNDGPAGQFLS